MISRHIRSGVKVLTLMFPCVLIGSLIAVLLTAHPVLAESKHVDVVNLNSEIGPGSLRFLMHAIDSAEHDGAQALIVEIDTPGGDIDSMNKMVKAELASHVPIISYVGPTGARAASAGAFVTLAAHIAVMAPTTRIGASSPVTAAGGDIDKTLKSKIENDLSASITSIQIRYKRNVPLAIAMITEAKSYDDVTAVQKQIVDLSAPDLNSVLAMVDGRIVTLEGGQAITLQTAGAIIQTLDTNLIDEFYGLLLDPNVVFLLFIVAMIGIYLEIAHPGAILPGVAGSIALLLFLFAVGSLSPNWAGLGLMLLAFALLVLDLRLPTHGVLTVGAVVSLIVGALIFFNSGNPFGGPQINPIVVYVMGGVIGIISFTLISFIIRAQRLPVTTGAEGMIGGRVIALTELAPTGRVRYGGENWAAVLDTPDTLVEAGTELQITALEGLRLHVRPVESRLLPEEQGSSTLE